MTVLEHNLADAWLNLTARLGKSLYRLQPLVEEANLEKQFLLSARIRHRQLCRCTSSDDKWTRYRLPKGSHCFDYKWQTEWPRTREVERERLLMNHHVFYELLPWAYGGRVWGVRLISTVISALGEECSWSEQTMHRPVMDSMHPLQNPSPGYGLEKPIICGLGKPSWMGQAVFEGKCPYKEPPATRI